MDIPGNDCPELTEKTADAIDDASLQQLFVSTQMNNLDLCGKAGIEWVSHKNVSFEMVTISRNALHLQNFPFDAVFVAVVSKFPHYWVIFTNIFPWMCKVWAQNRSSEKLVFIYIKHRTIITVSLWISPGGECHIFPPSDIIILFINHYEQNVCHGCTLFVGGNLIISY